MNYKILKCEGEKKFSPFSSEMLYDVKESYLSHGIQKIDNTVLFTGTLPECYAWIK